MTTVAVFGASGKIGQHAVRQLNRQGHHVRALVHRTPVTGKNVTCVDGSIANPMDCVRAINGAEVVIQLATTKEDAQTFFDVSIRGTFNVLEACRDSNSLKQFILLSGDAAQGIWFYPHPAPINESTPLAAYPGYYAFSKVMEETMTRQYEIQYKLPITILRSSWVFEDDDLLNHFSLLKNINPTEPGHGFGNITPDVLNLVRDKQEHIPILVDQAGEPLTRHIVHIADVTQAIGKAVGNKHSLGRDYNIAAAEPFQYRDAAELISKRLDIPTADIPNPDYHSFSIDISRAQQELDYEPAYDFPRMVESAIAARSVS